MAVFIVPGRLAARWPSTAAAVTLFRTHMRWDHSPRASQSRASAAHSRNAADTGFVAKISSAVSLRRDRP